MQNIQDWTSEICVTHYRVFVKGEVFALVKVCQLSSPLLTFKDHQSRELV